VSKVRNELNNGLDMSPLGHVVYFRGLVGQSTQRPSISPFKNVEKADLPSKRNVALWREFDFV